MSHQDRIVAALIYAQDALESAERSGRRTDCLRVAVKALEGALRNVASEDAAKKASE